MLIELNGLSFQVEILPGAPPAGLRARIVDEGFHLPPHDCPVAGPDCVTALIERYSGVSPGTALRRRIARLLADRCQPA